MRVHGLEWGECYRPHRSLGYLPLASETILMLNWSPGSATLHQPRSFADKPAMCLQSIRTAYRGRSRAMHVRYRTHGTRSLNHLDANIPDDTCADTPAQASATLTPNAHGPSILDVETFIASSHVAGLVAHECRGRSRAIVSTRRTSSVMFRGVGDGKDVMDG